MLIYLYDSITKEFLYSQEADRDPVESLKYKKFVPMLPAYSTIKEPPISKSGYARVFKDDDWVYKEDFRGITIINPSTDEVVVLDMLGAIPEGFITIDEYIKTDEYKEKEKARKKERISKLSMTKLDFYKYVLAPNGIDYNQLLDLLDSNIELKATWDLCQRVYRGDSTLCTCINEYLPEVDLDIIFEKYGV